MNTILLRKARDCAYLIPFDTELVPELVFPTIKQKGLFSRSVQGIERSEHSTTNLDGDWPLSCSVNESCSCRSPATHFGTLKSNRQFSFEGWSWFVTLFGHMTQLLLPAAALPPSRYSLSLVLYRGTMLLSRWPAPSGYMGCSVACT